MPYSKAPSAPSSADWAKGASRVLAPVNCLAIHSRPASRFAASCSRLAFLDRRIAQT